jgi:hypothetical protein
MGEKIKFSVFKEKSTTKLIKTVTNVPITEAPCDNAGNKCKSPRVIVLQINLEE